LEHTILLFQGRAGVDELRRVSIQCRGVFDQVSGDPEPNVVAAALDGVGVNMMMNDHVQELDGWMQWVVA